MKKLYMAALVSRTRAVASKSLMREPPEDTVNFELLPLAHDALRPRALGPRSRARSDQIASPLANERIHLIYLTNK